MACAVPPALSDNMPQRSTYKVVLLALWLIATLFGADMVCRLVVVPFCVRLTVQASQLVLVTSVMPPPRLMASDRA